MESPLSFFRMHWDHEPTRNRSAGFPACGFTGHSCPVFLLRATGKSPEPPDRNVCLTHPRSMESPHDLCAVHWDHEPVRGMPSVRSPARDFKGSPPTSAFAVLTSA